MRANESGVTPDATPERAGDVVEFAAELELVHTANGGRVVRVKEAA